MMDPDKQQRWLHAVRVADVLQVRTLERGDPYFAVRYPELWQQGVLAVVKDGNMAMLLFLMRNCGMCFEDMTQFTQLLIPAWQAACASGNLEIAQLLESNMDTENMLLSDAYADEFHAAMCAALDGNHEAVVQYLKKHEVVTPELSSQDSFP